MSKKDPQYLNDIIQLKNPNKPPMINDIKRRCLMLSPTVSAGLEPEAKFSDFEKDVREIGKGGFGSVWKVMHKQTQNIYCIKVVQKQGIIDQRLTEQMNREIEIMYLINHPHCLKLKNHFEDNENFYLVMPLCVKGQLYRILRKAKKFDEQTTAQVLRETISALKYLHSLNPPIIHRDLKPENLLLNENGRIFLADFGWSNFKNEGEIRKTFCGTPEYIAPEILKKEGHDHRVDIWSIGVLMFELLAGYSPFAAKTNPDLYSNIKKLKINWPDDMPPMAKNLISKILKLNPKERLTLDEILNHQWFLTTPEIIPLLKDDIHTNKEILLYHMLNDITPEIDSQVNKLLNINDAPVATSLGNEKKEKNFKRQSVMKQIKEKQNSSSGSNNHLASINIMKEQIDELKFQILKLTTENAGLKNKIVSNENDIKNLKEENSKLKEEGTKNLKEKILNLTSEIEKLQVKDKDRLNLLSELEEKNNVLREQNAKIKLLESQKDQIIKDGENLNNKIKELSKQIELKEITVDYLMKKNESLTQEKEQQTLEFQKKIEILHLNLLEQADGSNTQSMAKVVSILNESVKEMRNTFENKFTNFTLNNEEFKTEFISRNEKFTSILNEKSLSILEQIKKMKDTVVYDINKVFLEINKNSLDVKEQKIEWLNKQVNEMSVYKKKGLEYEKKISQLESDLKDSNDKLKVATTEVNALKQNVQMNKENIKKVHHQLNSTESKLSDYKTFIFNKAQNDEKLLDDYYILFNEDKSIVKREKSKCEKPSLII